MYEDENGTKAVKVIGQESRIAILFLIHYLLSFYLSQTLLWSDFSVVYLDMALLSLLACLRINVTPSAYAVFTYFCNVKLFE